MQTVTLLDRRLWLRPFTADDVPAVFAVCQDPEIQRWTSVPSPYQLSDAERFVTEIVPDRWADGSAAVFGVFERSSESLVGCLAIMNITPEDFRDGRMAEVGYWTAKQMRGRGLSTDAVRLACRWAFDELRVVRIEWYAHVGNEASWRVAEKVGFVMEGTLRSRLLHRGERRDAWLASLLPQDLA